MDIEKLCKERFMNPMKGEPTVRFSSNGVICLNPVAVKHLKLKNGKGFHGVSIYHDKSCHAEFSIGRDAEGWSLREDSSGRAVFNCVELARHVIDATWDRSVSHPVATTKPKSWVFRIARVPVDDDKNKDVYALLRKNHV